MTYFNKDLSNHLSSQDFDLWVSVNSLLMRVQDMMYARANEQKPVHYNCHVICRALANKFPLLRVEDGGYLGLEKDPNSAKFTIHRCRHSWLITPDDALIDPHPVGYVSLSPLLVPPPGKGNCIFGRSMYFLDPKVRPFYLNRDMMRNVRVMIKLMNKL